MEAPREVPQEAKDLPGEGSLIAACRDLKAVFQKLEALANQPGPSTRIAALRMVVELNDAMRSGRDCLAFLPQLMAVANAGAAMEDSIRGAQQTIDIGATNLDALRAELNLLLQQEETIRAQAKERLDLEKRLVELRQLEELANAVDELRRQLERVEEALSPDERKADGLQTRLEGRSRELVTLAETRLQSLRPGLRELLEMAQERQTELQSYEAELTATTHRLSETAGQLQERKRILELYRDFDRAVAEALPGATDAIQLLDRVDSLLAETDRVLQLLVRANTEAQRLTKLYLGGTR